MCGLLGMLTANANAATFVPAIKKALPCMHHRGPDEAGTWHDNDAVFGFNRLSIINHIGWCWNFFYSHLVHQDRIFYYLPW